MRLFLVILIILISIFVLSNNKKESTTKAYEKYFIHQETPKIDELHAQFFGVSSLLISDGKSNLLIDGFFSRPTLFELLFTKIKANKKRVNSALLKANINNLDAIFALHSHHDHAMDIPIISQLTNAPIFGSISTINIATKIPIIKNTELISINI